MAVVLSAEQIEISHVCLALNNLGVTLMERGHWREASRTFLAAVSSLKPLVSSRQRRLLVTASSSSSLSSSLLSNPAATAALTKVRAAHSQASMQATQPRMELPPTLDIISLEQGDQNALEHAQQYGPSQSVVFFIRFRSLMSQETLLLSPFSHLDYTVAVLLYNYATSRMCWWQRNIKATTTSSGEAKRLFATAHCYLVVAEGIVDRNLERYHPPLQQQQQQQQQQQPDSSFDSQSEPFYSLASLILSNQWVLHALQGRSDKAARVMESLGKLQQQQQQQLQQQQWHDASRSAVPYNGLGAAAA